jgi:hypothetical protein
MIYLKSIFAGLIAVFSVLALFFVGGIIYFRIAASKSQGDAAIGWDPIAAFKTGPVVVILVCRDAEPFRIERLSANSLACATIPIGCVTLIAFLAMKVGVHPRTLGAFVLLSGFVRSRPIVLGVPP